MINKELSQLFTSHGLIRLKERFPDKSLEDCFRDIYKGKKTMYFMYGDSFGINQKGITGEESTYVFSPDFKIKTVLEKKTLDRKHMVRMNKYRRKEIVMNFIMPMAQKINEISRENIFKSKFLKKIKKTKEEKKIARNAKKKAMIARNAPLRTCYAFNGLLDMYSRKYGKSCEIN